MKQYKITSANFVTPGDSGDPDAFMAPDDLAQLKKLAGMDPLGLLEDYAPGNSDFEKNAQIATDQDMPSPMGSKGSMTGAEKRQMEKQNHIKVGSPEWFKLWYAKPWLTGEKPVGDAPAKKIPVNKDNDKDRD
jgi:hypothetical protein